MNSIEFFNSISDEEKEQLEKSADILTEIFSANVTIGEATSHRLLSALLTDNDEDREYYSMVLKQCNSIMALMCRVLDIPDPTEEEEQK